MATAQNIADLDGQAHEILKRVGNGSLEVVDVRRAFQAIIEGRSNESSTVAAITRFKSEADQIANLLLWNPEFNLGFTEEQIAAVAETAPTFAWDRPLVALTLCWTLDTLERTIDAKLAIMESVYGRSKVIISPVFKTDAKHTTLVEGAPEFMANRLWWEVIDLGANRRMSPDQVPAATAAGTEVFDVVCHHPAYVKTHNGSDTPYLDVPGLRVKVRRESRPCAPDVRGGSDGLVEVGVGWAGYAGSSYAGPVRESQS